MSGAWNEVRRLTTPAARPEGVGLDEALARATGGGVDPVRRLPVERGAPTADMVAAAADLVGVCPRPVISKVTDLDTNLVHIVPIACGATRASKCKPCAERARKLRMQQCREGWHLDHEPERPVPLDELAATEGWFDLPGAWGPLDDDDEDQADEDPSDRRVRSTRRRQDAPDLPRADMNPTTIGQAFTGPDGKVWRPSMFITLTLPSYGRVDGEGVPLDPGSYDYRGAALDAIHFSKVADRFWQNLRRCCGFKAQYFATVEGQRRGAPHLHAAVRGAIPRRIVRAVRAATYHQVWWPAHDRVVYDLDHLPRWNDDVGGYVDEATGAVLPTWDEALDQLGADPDAEPAHVVRFGEQDDIKGLVAGTPDADKTIHYLCKYLTKDLAGTDQPDDMSDARARHLDRLAEEARWLPCSEGCANWLLYGVQPQGARHGMVPGQCKRRAHDPENLGYGGRRVLVSRQWTGKTLAGHKADRAAVVRAALEEAGVDPDDHDELSIEGTNGRLSWHILARSQVDEATYAEAIAESIETRLRWRREYEAAKERAGPPPLAMASAGTFGSSVTTVEAMT
jgi:hypothetical protein